MQNIYMERHLGKAGFAVNRKLQSWQEHLTMLRTSKMVLAFKKKDLRWKTA